VFQSLLISDTLQLLRYMALMWKVKGTSFSVYIPDFSMIVCNLAELPEEKLRANLADNAMLLLLQALLLRHPVEQIARIFLLLDSAMNRELMDTIRLFLNYVQQPHPDITESRIKQSIGEIAMQEGITTPMKFLRNTGFQNSTIRARRLGKLKELLRERQEEKLRGYAPQ